MKRLVLLIMVTVPFLAHCQQEKKKRRFAALGITFAPSFTNRSLDYAASSKWVADARDDEEKGNFGFTAGLQLSFRLRDKLRLETGLSYVNYSIKTKYQLLEWTSTGPALPTRSKIVYYYNFISLPLVLAYSFLDTKDIRLFVNASVATNMFTSKRTKVVMDYADGTEHAHASSKQVGYSTFNFSGRLGIGMDYQISKRLILRVEPYYQRSLSSIVADDQAKEYLYAFGSAFGIYYSL